MAIANLPDLPHHHTKNCYRFPPLGAILSYSINPFNPPPVLWTCYLVIPDCCGEGTLESLCCPQGRKLQWSSIKFGSYSARLDQARLSQSQPIATTSGQIITDIQNINFKLIFCLTKYHLFSTQTKAEAQLYFQGGGKKES